MRLNIFTTALGLGGSVRAGVTVDDVR